MVDKRGAGAGVQVIRLPVPILITPTAPHSLYQRRYIVSILTASLSNKSQLYHLILEPNLEGKIRFHVETLICRLISSKGPNLEAPTIFKPPRMYFPLEVVGGGGGGLRVLVTLRAMLAVA
jgi:hypothetical protein